ncbi:unnamed protein product [Gongylonema pulchrum]|uniref:Sterile alpha motif domain-containing protein 9-like n=1 Tax=Gongylonema pulchrum TaxID=637853 RepID=A0A183ET73_9BILA|nr:unnamed protein product [Gongylonema pulchrum]
MRSLLEYYFSNSSPVPRKFAKRWDLVAAVRDPEVFRITTKIEETSVSLKESRQNSSVTLQSQNEDEKRELTDQGNVLEEKTILEIAAKFEAEEELQPEHPDKNNILSTFGEKLDQSNEEAASPNPVTKVTASVAPLKQASESPVSFESEKFGKDDRMNKQGVCRISNCMFHRTINFLQNSIPSPLFALCE